MILGILQAICMTILQDNPHLIGGKDYFVGSGLGGIGDYTHILGILAIRILGQIQC